MHSMRDIIQGVELGLRIRAVHTGLLFISNDVMLLKGQASHAFVCMSAKIKKKKDKINEGGLMVSQ